MIKDFLELGALCTLVGVADLSPSKGCDKLSLLGRNDVFHRSDYRAPDAPIFRHHQCDMDHLNLGTSIGEID